MTAPAPSRRSRRIRARRRAVLLDLQLPDRQGIDVLVAFREALPATPIAVVPALESRDGVLRALRFGAMAYIGKSANTEYVADALRALIGMMRAGRACVMASRLSGSGVIVPFRH